MKLKKARLSDDGSHYLITLSKGKEAKIDAKDAIKVACYSWKANFSSCRWYAKRNMRIDGRSKSLSMARFIMNAPEGIQVDHINGDSLDNRKSNLRLCSHRENHYGARVRKPNFSSKFRGVYWTNRDKAWRARIMYNWKNIHIGSFVSEIEAAIARDFFSHMLHGEFAQINIPS